MRSGVVAARAAAASLRRRIMPPSFSVLLRRYEVERLADGKRYALKKFDLAALSQLDRVAVVGEIRLLVRAAARFVPRNSISCLCVLHFAWHLLLRCI